MPVERISKEQLKERLDLGDTTDDSGCPPEIRLRAQHSQAAWCHPGAALCHRFGRDPQRRATSSPTIQIRMSWSIPTWPSELLRKGIKVRVL